MSLYLILKVIFLISLFALIQTIRTGDQNDKKYKVVCFWSSRSYYRRGDGRLIPEEIDTKICTHLVYGFAKLNENYEISAFDPYLDTIDHLNEGIGCYKQFNSLKKLNQKLSTMIALGDMTHRREKYLEMIANEETRQIFVKSVFNFLVKHDFDGLELTWEYPGVYHNPLDTESTIKKLILLLNELHDELSSKGFILSVSLSITEKNINENLYNISTIEKYVDFINLLTFEFHAPTNEEHNTSPNAPLEPNEKDSMRDQKFTIQYAVDHWLNTTLNSKKLVLGIPAFGHSFKLVSSTDHDWKAPISGTGITGRITKSPGILGYNEICELQQKESNEWQIFNDPEYKVPYMWKGDQFISFDDPKSIKSKLDFLKDKHLGGAIIWTIDTDDFRGKCGSRNFTITSMIMKELNNS